MVAQAPLPAGREHPEGNPYEEREEQGGDHELQRGGQVAQQILEHGSMGPQGGAQIAPGKIPEKVEILHVERAIESQLLPGEGDLLRLRQGPYIKGGRIRGHPPGDDKRDQRESP